jgi:endo-1,4-beta-D-glucanase Y
MKLLMKRTGLLTALLTVLLFKTGFGQASMRFPQNVKYSFGFMPGTITYQNARNTYERWKDLFLVVCNDGYRVTCESEDETRVEAIGFGTILAAYYGDKQLFDGLYQFYESKRTKNANYMMAWNVSCDGINDPGSATDGDIDVTFALIVAHTQWGGDYLEKARNIINIIKNSVITTCDGLFAIAPGYSIESDAGPMWGGCDLTDIQYYTPAFFRIFAKVSGDPDWNKLADDSYIILNAAAHPTTGLVPDWQSVDGTPGGDSYRIPYFRYDACRVPWRMALDYLWNGNENAREWCVKVSNWANSIGPANIRDGYNLDGTENNQGNHNSAFLGGFAVSAMCNSQTVADAFATEMVNIELGDGHWFSLSTRSLYLLTITGNFWKPEHSSDIEQ